MSKKEEELFKTEAGRLSYPFLYDPYVNDEGKQSWGCQVLVTPEEFKKSAGPIVNAINTAGKKSFGDSYELKTAKNKPIEKTDDMLSMTDDRTKGLVCFKCKATGPVYVVNAQGKAMSSDEIGKIKGGHWGKAIFGIYTYDKNGNKGVGLGLKVLQYWKADEEFGVGLTEALKLVDTLDVPLADIPMSNVVDSIL